MTKFKTRILPQLLSYAKEHSVPPTHLTFSLAALITFYRGQRGNEDYPLADDPEFIEFYKQAWDEVTEGKSSLSQLVIKLLANEKHWGTNLNQVPNLEPMVTSFVELIVSKGMRQALNDISKRSL